VSRLLATLRLDAAIQYRYGLYAASLFMVLAWGVILGLLVDAAALPPRDVVPAFMLCNLLVTTFYFMAAAVLFARSEGTLHAAAASPLRPAEFLLSKVATLSALALVESAAIVALLFGVRGDWGLLLAGALAAAALYALLGFVAVARYRAIGDFLMPSVLIVTVLLLPLLPHAALVDARWLLAHPLEPAMALMRAAYSPAGPAELAYGALGSALWLGVAAAWALRRYRETVSGEVAP
jgi:fluoroquinolone transport system permease protein